MTMTKDTVKADFQKLIQDMDKTNEDAKKVLQEADRKIAEADLQYAKMLIKEEIDDLKIAKQILEKNK